LIFQENFPNCAKIRSLDVTSSNGRPLPELDLFPLFQAFLQHSADALGDIVRAELEQLLQQRAVG
jgi:hypothetical protein